MSTTSELAKRILTTAPEHEDWSLVESSNSAGCYDALLAWATDMTYQTWRRDRLIRPAELGLVLLWLESEAARRKGGDGTVWPALSHPNTIQWKPEIYAQLFNGNGNPTSEHRKYLQLAATEYSLRNTFDEDGQNWYRLIYLQFGFTHDDAVVRLANWLSGQETFSVQRLLSANDSGARSFQHLWSSLRLFRLRNLPEATLRTRLNANPWVLPEWNRDLINAAKRSSAQIMGVADWDAAEIQFFTAPKLAMSPQGVPTFTISLCNLPELHLESSDYQVKSGERVLTALTRQPDGTYFQTDGRESITLSVQPSVPISLVARDGRIAAHDEALLWDPGEEITLYSCRTGNFVPANENLRLGSEVFVIACGDVEIRPTPLASYDLAQGYRLHHIAARWTDAIRAYLGDDVVWTSAVATRSQEPALVLSARFTTELNLSAPEWVGAAPPWNLPIHVRVPQGWTFSKMRWRRADGQRLEFEQMPPHLPLTEADAIRPVLLRIQLTNGLLRRSEAVKVSVPFVAVLKWSEDGTPRRHYPGRNLMLGEARRVTWSFCLPSNGSGVRDAREFSFVEGNHLFGRLKARVSALPDLAGYGASLQVLDDPYQVDLPVMTIADCVLDGGALGAVNWCPEQAGFHISSSCIELGDDHRLLVWRSRDDEPPELTHIPREQLSVNQDGWLWPSGNGQRLHALALTYRGTRLGAWFDHESWSAAVIKSCPASLESTAALLRDWKAPLLKKDGDHFRNVSTWFLQHYARVLPVWLGASNVGAIGIPANESWFSAVNDVLTETLPVPTDETAADLVERLAPNASGVSALGTAMWRLVEVCPILTARIVKLFLEEFVTPAARNAFLTPLLALDEFVDTEERAQDIARRHGDRDSYWLMQTVPTLAAITQHAQNAIRRPYRLLSKTREYRYYALGRWLREIR